jgi:hypothetical protein
LKERFVRTSITRFLLGALGLCGLAHSGSGHAGEVTATEARWLQGAWPVLLYARDAGLPLDIVVQPQPTPGLPPMALAFIDGRCKMVFSMRGNPEVEATAQRLPRDLFDAAVQLMAAHELGHCQRHVSGAWRVLPAGRVEQPRPVGQLSGESDARLLAEVADMHAVRREEGHADLVGLAWTHRHHPALYARVHAWLLAERSLGRIAGSHHDTLAWVRLAAQADRLADGSIFAAADALWATGLDAEP